MKELIREVIREELGAAGMGNLPMNSKKVMEVTGWSYSKLKRLKAKLGAWKNDSGELMFAPEAIMGHMKTVRVS